MANAKQTKKSGTAKKQIKINTTKEPKGLSDKQMDDITKNTGKTLAGEEKVNLIIPKLDGESDYVECGINGYNYVIKKGEMVSVPRSVVDVLRNAKIL